MGQAHQVSKWVGHQVKVSRWSDTPGLLVTWWVGHQVKVSRWVEAAAVFLAAASVTDHLVQLNNIQLLLAFWEEAANREGVRKGRGRGVDNRVLLRDDQSRASALGSDVQQAEVPEGSGGPEEAEPARLFIKSEKTNSDQ